MELNFKHNNKDIIKAVNFIKKWTPSKDNNAKNPAEDALWHIQQMERFLGILKREPEAVKELMDCDFHVKNRPKGLPSIDKVYKLLKADYVKRCGDYGRMINQYRVIVDLWNEINMMDAHIYAASTENPKSIKGFEAGIETSAWKIISGIGPRFWKKLDSHSKYNDYENYGKNSFSGHPFFDNKHPEVPASVKQYRMFVYLGRNVTQRPLFAVLHIFHSTGNVMDDIKKIPNDWTPVYVNVPEVAQKVEPETEAK